LKKLIVDTNIMFSVLLGKSKKIREILFSSEDFKPYSCKFSIVEPFKHKDKLIKNSDDSLREAYVLCNDIDEKDLLFVALAIELDGLLWTGDKELLKGLKSKGFEKVFILK
jgi:predicted nucleic acid-binding protein